MSEELMVLTPQMEGITGEILAHKATVGRSCLEIGRLLAQAKEQLPHGQWLPWLRERVDFSERTAQQFMRVSREYASNPQLAADLRSVRKALALLALPEEEREGFAAEHDAAGMSARELEELIRRKKMAEDALAQSGEDYVKLLDEYNEQRQELEALKSRPVEVAVETVRDEAAIQAAADAARAEAEQSARQERERLSARIAQLEADAKQVRESRDTSSAAEERIRAAETEAAELRRQLATSANEDVLAVKVLYQQMVDLANRMQGRILRLETRQDPGAANCRKAVAALAQKLAEMGGGHAEI